MNRQNEFDLLLKATKTGSTRKIPEQPAYIYPLALEKQYAKYISDVNKKIFKKIEEKLGYRIKSWINRSDSFADDFDAFIRDMEDELIALYGASFFWGSPIYEIVWTMAQRIYVQNKSQWQKQLRAVLTVDWPIGTDWWDAIHKEWSQTNFNLIKNQSREFVDKIVPLVLAAMTVKTPYEELISKIKKLSENYTGYRAELLARDQVGILNSMIWKKEYEEVGMPYYIWQTAMDERVRGNPTGRYPKAIPSHWIMQGLLMKWEDRSVFSDDGGKTWKKKTPMMELLHVGEAIACRCVPVPFWGDKLNRSEG